MRDSTTDISFQISTRVLGLLVRVIFNDVVTTVEVMYSEMKSDGKLVAVSYYKVQSRHLCWKD
jgi:hypothetical protein